MQRVGVKEKHMRENSTLQWHGHIKIIKQTEGGMAKTKNSTCSQVEDTERGYQIQGGHKEYKKGRKEID
jgi:hypothetical protein